MMTNDQEAGGAQPLNPHSIYTKKRNLPGYDKVPHCVYFYYMPSDPVAARHYLYDHGGPLAWEAVPEKMVELAAAARSGAPAIGQNWQYIAWNRISYIAIVRDDITLEFAEGRGLVFNQKHGGRRNDSFFDGMNTDINVGDVAGDLAGLYFINHMKAEGGSKLDDWHEYYSFSLNFSPRAAAENFTEADLEYPDSGGTNMGPPVPPP